MSKSWASNLLFRLFRMLLIITGLVGAMALLFPLISQLTGPAPLQQAPSEPAAR